MLIVDALRIPCASLPFWEAPNWAPNLRQSEPFTSNTYRMTKGKQHEFSSRPIPETVQIALKPYRALGAMLLWADEHPLGRESSGGKWLHLSLTRWETPDALPGREERSPAAPAPPSGLSLVPHPPSLQANETTVLVGETIGDVVNAADSKKSVPVSFFLRMRDLLLRNAYAIPQKGCGDQGVRANEGGWEMR